MKQKKRKRLPPYLVKQRKRLFFDMWLAVKEDLSMSEFAEVLAFPLDQLFKILKARAKELKTKI